MAGFLKEIVSECQLRLPYEGERTTYKPKLNLIANIA
jgi:hypothetical protein